MERRFGVVGVLWVLLALVVAIAPFFVGVITLNTIVEVGILAVVIMSSNLLTGVTGQISLAQGSFLGLGAYTTAILIGSAGWPAAAALPVAVLIAAVVGALAGLPALRISGIQLALVTLGIALVFPTLVMQLSFITRGGNGIQLTNTLPAPSGFPFAGSVWAYWVLAAIALAVLPLMRNLLTSRVGRSLVAIRDNQQLAASMGVDVPRHKIAMFAASAGLAGLAGWMFAVHYQFISPQDVSLMLSINIVLAMTLGGAGTIAGPVVGALFLKLAPTALGNVGIPPILVPAAEGIVLVLVLFLLPRGIAGTLGPLLRRIGRVPALPSPERHHHPVASPPAQDPATPLTNKEKSQ